MRSIKVLVVIAACFLLPLLGLAPQKSAASKLKPASQGFFGTHLGDPVPGLDQEELGKFQSGLIEFSRDHTLDEGLGPLLNDTNCAACHGFPVVGGSLDSIADLTFRMGRLKKNGQYDGLERLGGEPVSKKSISNVLGLSNCVLPDFQFPKKAQFISSRAGQQLFGEGLIDAITDQAILANADPDDRDGDGISGRGNMVFSAHFKDTRLGRFGWKAHMPSLLDFCGDAYIVELGITNPDFPTDRATKCDFANDPEDIDGRVTQAFVDFISFLAPPEPKQLDSSGQRGKNTFASLGCVKCHIPKLQTATLSENPDISSPILAAQDVFLYSDLLLHDMGPELEDGIATGQATGREWRTQPLWGLSTKRFFLHDARTSNVDDAIRAHGGEAAKIRDRYLKLSNGDKQDLLKFLNSL